MSKRRKTGRESEQQAASATDRDVATNETSLSNRAVAEQLAGLAPEKRDVGLDTVRDVAFPLVERASLALHLEPRPAADVERFLAILERGHFDRAHKDALIDKVEGDQAAAVAVQEAVERSLGAIDEDVRTEIIGVLEQTWTALHEGSPGESSWIQGDREFPLSEAALQGSAGDRAGGLIADLVEHFGSDTLKQGLEERGSGASVARFCRSVVLAYFFDEEEEEEEHGVVSAPEES